MCKIVREIFINTESSSACAFIEIFVARAREFWKLSTVMLCSSRVCVRIRELCILYICWSCAHCTHVLSKDRNKCMDGESIARQGTHTHTHCSAPKSSEYTYVFILVHRLCYLQTARHAERVCVLFLKWDSIRYIVAVFAHTLAQTASQRNNAPMWTIPHMQCTIRISKTYNRSRSS